VFQKADPAMAYGSYRAFGHDGANGAFAAADPLYGISYGYIPRRFATPAGANGAVFDLVRTLVGCVA